jgi:CRISPR-associated endonuclease Cas2
MPGSNIFIDLLLDCFDRDFPLMPFETPYAWLKRRKKRDLQRKQYQEAVWKLRRSGLIEMVVKNHQKFLKLTSEGQLRILIKKAGVKKENWDGKWRVIMFDIPERARQDRNKFRALLKTNGFLKLQASVFISPYSLNSEAIQYLKETGLIGYIRILRVDKMDDEDLFLKKFKLHHS